MKFTYKAEELKAENPIPRVAKRQERWKQKRLELVRRGGSRKVILTVASCVAALSLCIVAWRMIRGSEKLTRAETHSRSTDSSAYTKASSGSDFEVAKKRVLLVHGSSSAGTAFLVRMDGKTYAMSCEHVIRDSQTPEMVMVDGTKLELGDLSIAEDRDMARYEVKAPVDAFDISEVAPNNGDAVWIYGNSQGDDVITTLGGEVTGVGSDRLKVNAEIVGGNSGSPILSSDGRVVAVAAYLRNGDHGEDWTTKDTQFDKVRRFGVRFNGAKWIAIDKRTYIRQCAMLEQLQTYMKYVSPYLICDTVDEKKLDSLKLEYKDVYRKHFGSDEAGFHHVLLALSASYAKQADGWRVWRKILAERNALLAELNEEIRGRKVSQADAEKTLRNFDETNQILAVHERVRVQFVAFIAKRKEALTFAVDFLKGEQWPALIQHGYRHDDISGSVDWYLQLIQNSIDENDQRLNDFNKGLRKLASDKSK